MTATLERQVGTIRELCEISGRSENTVGER
jgi:hypothetical protein